MRIFILSHKSLWVLILKDEKVGRRVLHLDQNDCPALHIKTCHLSLMSDNFFL